MTDDNDRRGFKNIFKVGTPECAVFLSILGMVLGLMILLLGFWRAILVAAIAAVFGFLGGVKDKKAFFRNLINKLFPPKENNFPGSDQAGKNKIHYTASTAPGSSEMTEDKQENQ